MLLNLRLVDDDVTVVASQSTAASNLLDRAYHLVVVTRELLTLTELIGNLVERVLFFI